MSGKVIQQQFGERVVASLGAYAGQHAEAFGEDIIQEFSAFARTDIDSVPQLEAGLFKHVLDPDLRLALAQVLYGTRWLYKLGLALLTKNEERAAHVRAQIVDYASVVEALLSYCNGRAIDNGYIRGQSYRWKDPDTKFKPISWTPGKAQASPILRKLPLWWQARIANETGVVNKSLFDRIDRLREERNTVHIRERVSLGATAYLNQSKDAFDTLLEAGRQTGIWCAGHPG